MASNEWHDFMTEAEAGQIGEWLTREGGKFILLRLSSHDIALSRPGDGRVCITVGALDE